jgi:hypothetical protein
MIRGLACIALLALAGCAGGDFAIKPPVITRQEPVLPPKEFDYPYRGKLTVTRSPSQAEIRANCSPTSFPYHLGCARLTAFGCDILMADDAFIRKSGWTPEIVMRHEIGHCNGWPGDHRGGRQP